MMNNHTSSASLPIVYFHFFYAESRFKKVESLFQAHGLKVVRDLNETVLQNVEYIVVKSRPITDEFLKQFKKCKAVISFGREPWMISISEPNIKILSLKEDRGYEVSEHAIALALYGLKRIPYLRHWKYLFSPRNIIGWFLSRHASETRGAHNWTKIQTDTIYGKKVGIVGYGAIGRQIHQRLKGFNCSVYYSKQNRLPEAMEKKEGLTFSDLENMFSLCDMIFLQTPLTSDTHGSIDEKILSRAKSNLVLINCGRAACVDQKALLKVLLNKKIRFYAADVFWREPMPMLTPFRFLRNCLITPHMAESLPQRLNLVQDLLETILEVKEAKCTI